VPQPAKSIAQPSRADALTRTLRGQDRIIDRETSTIYIIMEFCENGDLASVIRKHKRAGKRMEESKIWALLFQISCALHECHCRKQKILHRDIKPANVFIDKQHGFKLGDFGLARVLGTETQFARTNVGTPYYMAPEQVRDAHPSCARNSSRSGPCTPFPFFFDPFHPPGERGAVQ
jgi:serine/threonine protein kinase